jgi:hypothetical protein
MAQIRWGSHSNKHSAQRGCAYFKDIVPDNNLSPFYWLWLTDAGTLTIWGPDFHNKSEHKQTLAVGRIDSVYTEQCSSKEAGRKAAEKFIEAEYKGHLSNKLAKLDKEREILVSKLAASG